MKKYLPPDHDSLPYKVTDALIAIAFVGVVVLLVGGWL